MQHSKTLDTLVGLFIASGVLALFFMAMQVSNLSSFIDPKGYLVTANFENSGGLKVKSPVSVAGVRVGRVSNITLDLETFQSVVELRINPKYNTLPDDTTASIYTAGLLGEQYVSLDPGGSETYLESGGEIDITQSALVLEEIIGQLLFEDKEDNK